MITPQVRCTECHKIMILFGMRILMVGLDCANTVKAILESDGFGENLSIKRTRLTPGLECVARDGHCMVGKREAWTCHVYGRRNKARWCSITPSPCAAIIIE